jgi:hypothetical protein
MATTRSAAAGHVSWPALAVDPAASLTAALVAVVAAAAALAGWFPIAFSIAIVFLFAGPHNWLEARYFMTRMPARWGRLQGFFSLGIAGADVLTAQITRHAGAGIVPRLSTHFLVAAHTFLEMLHYGVWCFGLPLLALGARPWRLAGVPLARRSAAWRRGLVAVMVAGGLVVTAFWAGFFVDYPLTRSIYFTVALAHVLAEVPFLLREA